MSSFSFAAAAEVAHDPVLPFIVGAIALVVFFALGVVTWSYRDVYNRQGAKPNDDSQSTGH